MKIKFSKSINNNLEENEVVLSIQHNNKNKGLNSFIKYIQEYNPVLPDQSAINVCVEDKKLILSSVYNFYPHNKYY